MFHRWFIRTGTALVIFGFMLAQGIWLLTTLVPPPPGVDQAEVMPPVYVVSMLPLTLTTPVAMLFIFAITFFPISTYSQARGSIAGLVICVGVSTVGLLMEAFYIIPYLWHVRLLSILAGRIAVFNFGYLLISIGIGLQWLEMNKKYSPNRSQGWEREGARRINNMVINTTGSASCSAAQSPARPAVRTTVPGTIKAQQPTQGNRPWPVSAYLEFIKGNRLPGGKIWIRDGDLAIGRARGNQLQILDRAVSRHHARIRFARTTWFVQDLDSLGGTYVNRRRVQTTRIHSGDRILIGHNQFVFHSLSEFSGK